ncbi:MAG: competence protein ComJ [Methylovirgula sp.]
MTMPEASFFLDVSYSQVAVFDSALEHPFNLWTERHVKQGFSWRPGSVSFATLEESGRHVIEVDAASDEVALSFEAVRIIETPFEVPLSGSIEFASISDSVTMELTPGSYTLRFEYSPAHDMSLPRIKFVFAKFEKPSFKILRADPTLSAVDGLLLSASPA